MALKQALAVTNTVASAEPCLLYELKGVWSGAAVAYLQIYDAKALPDDAVVPKISIALAAASAFSFTFQSPIKLDRGCVIGFSSTNATKTISTGAGNTGNIFAVTDYAYATAITVEATAENIVSVTNSEPIILKGIQVTGDSSTDNYLMIFAKPAPEYIDSPIFKQLVLAGETKVLCFGDGIVIGEGMAISGSKGDGTDPYNSLTTESMSITAIYKVTGT